MNLSKLAVAWRSQYQLVVVPGARGDPPVKLPQALDCMQRNRRNSVTTSLKVLLGNDIPRPKDARADRRTMPVLNL